MRSAVVLVATVMCCIMAIIARTDAMHDAPANTSYLVYASASYGRYSNNRMTIVEAIGLAIYTNRTLIAPALGGCPRGQLRRLYDVHRARIRELTNAQDLRPICGDTGVAVWRGKQAGASVLYRGVVFRVMRPLTEYPVNVRGLDSHMQRAVTRTGLAALPPYDRYFPRAYAVKDIPIFMADPLLPVRLARVTERCLLLATTFMNVNWAVMPSTYKEASAALHPSAGLEDRVATWFHTHSVTPHAAVGVHLRIGDLAKQPSGLARDCERDPSFVVRNISHLLAALPRSAKSQPLLIASDSFASRCTRAVLKAFPHHVRIDPPFPSRHCAAAAFVHEVLGRTAGLVGNGVSTFSVRAKCVDVGARHTRRYLPIPPLVRSHAHDPTGCYSCDSNVAIRPRPLDVRVSVADANDAA